MQDLELELNITSNNSNIDCYVPLSVSAPLIEPIASSVNLAQETITISVLNSGTDNVSNLSLQLGSDAMVNVPSTTQSLNNLNAGQYTDITFSFSPSYLFVPGSVLSLPLNNEPFQDRYQSLFHQPIFHPKASGEYGYTKVLTSSNCDLILKIK